MKRSWRCTVPPTVEPLPLALAKSHLRVDWADEDALILQLIRTAREWAESYQGRAYCTQTWRLNLDEFPGSDEAITLPRPPLQSVSEIKYTDAAGTVQTLDPSLYLVDADAEPARILPAYGKTWPDTQEVPNAVQVTYTAGYTGGVPAAVQQAMLLLVGHWYANREAVLAGTISKEIEFAVESLLGMDRVEFLE